MPLPADPLPCTGARVRRLTRRMTAVYEQHLRPLGIKLSQYAVLMHLEREPQSMSQLAARLEMDRTTLTRALGPLVDQGWVANPAGPDARQRLVALSPAGLEFRRLARQHWARAQLALEAQLGRDFVADLNRQLEEALERIKPLLPEDN